MFGENDKTATFGQNDVSTVDTYNEFDKETKARLDNTLFYSSLAGGDPNDVYDYSPQINQEIYGKGASDSTAWGKNDKLIQGTKRTLGEKLKTFTMVDLMAKMPFSPWHDYAKKGYDYAKKKLKSGGYSRGRWEMTPMGGYTMVELPFTKKELETIVDTYEEESKRPQSVPATIFDGVTALPAYMIEFAVGGAAAKSMGISTVGKGIIAASGVRTALQPHRVASALIDQKNKGETGATALLKAYGDTYIENLTEAAGENVVPLLKKMPFGGKLFTEMEKIAAKLKIPKSEFANRISTKAGWNGLLGEWGEERLATVLRAVFDIDDFGAGENSNIADRMAAGLMADMQLYNQLAELGVLSFPVGVKMIANYAVPDNPVEIEKPQVQEAAQKLAEPTKAPEIPATPTEPTSAKPAPQSQMEAVEAGKVEKVEPLTEEEKKVILSMPAEAYTPKDVLTEVNKKSKINQPASDSETQNATNLLENYWREYDEREFEINVRTSKNQESIAKALEKKNFAPDSDIETESMSLAMMLYIDLKEHPKGHEYANQLTEKQKAVYDQSQNLPDNIKKIADQIIQENKKAGLEAVEKDVIQNARENYIAHLWKQPKKEVFQARFRQSTARARARTLEGGIVEGLSQGRELRIKDITLASQIAQSQVNQAYVGKQMLEMGKKWGLLSHKQPEGWIQVEHPGFTTWKWSGKAEEAKTYGRNFFVTEKGDLMERVPVYAEPELGKKLNKIFSPSGLYKIPGIKTITKYNAHIKSTILYTSLFHHQAFLRSYAFGSRGLNPKTAYKTGNQAINNMVPEIRLLVRNGLTLGRIQDYDARMIDSEQTIWGRALAMTKPTDAANKKLQAFRRKQEDFLFKKMGPYLKTQAAILELKAELKRNQSELENGEITVDEIAKSVANLINNDFGGLHLGRMGRSQTAQHLFRLLALAPDWTESNIRSAVDAFRGGETGHMHRMFWGRIAAKGLGATILFNLLLSAFDDDDFFERYKKAWEEGHLRWLEVDITPIYRAMGGTTDKRKYFSLLGHFRDPIKFVAHPLRSAKHKNSVMSRIMLDLMTGQDWAGREFTTIGELTGITENGKMSGRLVKYGRGGAKPLEPTQVPSYMLYEVRATMPIPMQNLISFIGGELDAFDAITKSMGMMTSTTYPEKKKSTRRKIGRRG